jgi:hypothetical protein
LSPDSVPTHIIAVAVLEEKPDDIARQPVGDGESLTGAAVRRVMRCTRHKTSPRVPKPHRALAVVDEGNDQGLWLRGRSVVAAADWGESVTFTVIHIVPLASSLNRSGYAALSTRLNVS